MKSFSEAMKIYKAKGKTDFKLTRCYVILDVKWNDYLLTRTRQGETINFEDEEGSSPLPNENTHEDARKSPVGTKKAKASKKKKAQDDSTMEWVNIIMDRMDACTQCPHPLQVLIVLSKRI